MLKLEMEEIRLLLSLIENAQIQGSLVPLMANLIEKIQKEYIKLEGKDGKK